MSKCPTGYDKPYTEQLVAKFDSKAKGTNLGADC
jgi:hypothetical protein